MCVTFCFVCSKLSQTSPNGQIRCSDLWIISGVHEWKRSLSMCWSCSFVLFVLGFKEKLLNSCIWTPACWSRVCRGGMCLTTLYYWSNYMYNTSIFQYIAISLNPCCLILILFYSQYLATLISCFSPLKKLESAMMKKSLHRCLMKDGWISNKWSQWWISLCCPYSWVYYKMNLSAEKILGLSYMRTVKPKN